MIIKKFPIPVILFVMFISLIACSEEQIAETGDMVTVHYTGKLNDGTVFDSSEGRDPLVINLGENRVIPGFENGLLGMKVGETKTITIPPEEGYGARRDDLIGNIPRELIPEGTPLDIGSTLQSKGQNGQVVTAKILEVTDDSVTVDMNFPLAGETLIFEVELIEISKVEG